MISKRWLLVTALSAVLESSPLPLFAQDLTIIIGKPAKGEPASFGGSGATPISPTTVIQFVMEPRDSGGSQLAYVIAIRGAPDWYRQRTQWGPGDSLSGFDTQKWQVGEVRYSIAYSKQERRLQTFNADIDLTWANVVYVTLGPKGSEDATVVANQRVTFVLLEPGGFAQHFVPAVAELRLFAGLNAEP
jgi:hypothetical protein